MIGSKPKYFCSDDISLIENYEKAVNDDTQIWHCHHRLETHTSSGDRRVIDITKTELIALDMYYHRSASELIFLTLDEHRCIHQSGMLNKSHTEETRHKISDKLKGRYFSEEHRRKLSEAGKGKHDCLGEKNPFYGKHHTEETRRKIAEKNRNRKPSREAVEKQKQSAKIHGYLWFNNGVYEIRSNQCPEGFHRGRLKRKVAN